MLVNFPVHVSRKSFLSTVSHYVSHGFCRYTTGTISVQKAPKLVKKFDQKYSILDTKNDFDRKRRHGIARCRLVLFYPNYHQERPALNEPLHFILFSTIGSGAVQELERLSEAKPGQPIRYDKLTCRKESGIRGGGRVKSAWSWHFNQEFYQQMRESCLHAVRMRDLKQAKLLTGRLMSYPPFHGIRAQRAAIFGTMRRTAIHAGHPAESLNFIPEKQFWVRKGRKETISLSHLLKH
ncbi:hypothetical protein Q9252_05860 [Marinobacter salarius]|uniref:hypothetical protein n=1 Tax=Marinobacter salarius TaxID=1420917 RepID=UPI00273BF1A4|nr:hypothetical protein [Marinobacter salarius]MDP4531662.1 hypothetical protein [Marinobacter salarius]